MHTAVATKQRIASVDILRGIVMVIMALDHTRDFFSNFRYDPTDLEHTNMAMFFTRWITHYCAPVFIFLSGTSAMLSAGRGKSKKESAWLLFTRGLWLILLEITVVRIGWQFDLGFNFLVLQVIWAIGCSMMVLSLLIFLPLNIIAAFGLLLVLAHNTLDNIHAKELTTPLLWNIFHEQGFVALGKEQSLFVIYPLVPWVGVMALGYCFGKVLLKPAAERNRLLRIIGGTAIILFVVLRATGMYGDPMPWKQYDETWKTALSFINCTKYPPSLLYLLMTIGPAIFIMPWLENFKGRISNFFTVFGRVPMFYYLLHIYVIHTLAMTAGVIHGFHATDFIGNDKLFNPASGWGFPLGWVYFFWAMAIAILYFPSAWFMRIKMKYKNKWLSYI